MLLADPNFLELINQKIIGICEKTYDSSDAKIVWEELKKEVRRAAKTYSKSVASEERLVISQLFEKVSHMEDQINELSESDLKILDNSKDELNELTQKRVRGVMFRTKAKWSIEGEKNTKYFFNLERARYNSKTCSTLLENGIEIRDPDQIMKCQQNFYQELYTSDKSVKFQLENQITNVVPDDSAGAKENQFELCEVQDAIKGMKNGSCPGPDGLPAEFYKMFWSRISNMYMKMMDKVFADEILHDTARTGVLNLIPKKSKDTRLLKNLRPITLLNVDYKIIEKCVANRMTPALSEIIHEDQRGFLPDRKIAVNIRKILDTVLIAQEEDLDGLIMSCDYMKCFDRIENECVIKAMEYMQFSSILRKWTRIMYCGFSIKIQNNGYFSSPVQVTRSVHQGGPASNCLFLCVAELIAVSLRGDSNIKGLFIRDILQFLNQFADDMDITMENDQTTLNNVLKRIKEFQNSTGFKLSYEKTNLYRVGSMRKSKAKLYTAEEMVWADRINVLGIEVCEDINELLEANYLPVIAKLKKVLNQWSNRNLSLFGKINVINALVGSLFVYKMSVLPSMSTDMYKVIDQEIERYLWAGHKPKIPLEVLRSGTQYGGAKLVDFRRKDVAMKCAWVKRVMEGDYPSEIVYSELQVRELKEIVWCCNLKEEHLQSMRIQNLFWQDVLRSWCRYHYTPGKEGDTVIWLNSEILIQHRPVMWVEAFAKGLVCVSQLVCEGKFIEECDAQERYGLSMFEYNQLKCAIPRRLKNSADYPMLDEKYRKFMEVEKEVKLVYRCLDQESPWVRTKQQKWITECGDEEWTHTISALVAHIPRISTIMKLRSFQYRLLLRAVVTNVHLHRWKIKESDACGFCGKDSERYEHLFFSCEKVQKLWHEAIQICQDLNIVPPVLSYASVISNISGHSATDTVIAIVKQFIYRQKCLQKDLCHRQLKSLILEHRNIEKYYAVKDQKLIGFLRKWQPGSRELNNSEFVEQYVESM